MRDPRSDFYARRHRERCAALPWTRAQALAYVGVAVACLAAVAVEPYRSWIVASYVLAFLFAVAVLLRMVALVLGLLRDPTLRVAPAAGDDLPVYTVLVPLLDEPEVVPRLLGALRALDYPPDRLDVQFLCEHDDAATIAALRDAGLPAHMRITTAPPGPPRTKPRVCNEGLAAARGEFVVIYDAEDRPDPDQLRKAVAAYRRVGDDVVCLQCRLEHYNSRQNLFTAWMAVDYLAWFRLILPGLQSLASPMPLGGTSNHFRTTFLRSVGGWDPFNVTEDCDLGMRIARAGKRTAMLDAATAEEAVAGLGPYLRQRSRWIKGYWQTWMVHTRCGAAREFGAWGFFLFVAHTGGTVLLQAIAPFTWLVIALWLFVGWSVVDLGDPLSGVALAIAAALLAANLVLIAIGLLACWRYRRADLSFAAATMPLGWLLQSVASWKALAQFVRRPSYWEKTRHGRAVEDVAGRGREWIQAPATAAFALCCVAGLGFGAWFNLHRDVERQVGPAGEVQRPLSFAGRAAEPLWEEFGIEPVVWEPGAEVGNPPPPLPAGAARAVRAEARFPGSSRLLADGPLDLADARALAFDCYLPPAAPEGIQFRVHLRSEDGFWFQHHASQRAIPGKWARVEVDLRDRRGWQAWGHGLPWQTHHLHRLGEVGVTVTGHDLYVGELAIANLRAPHREGSEVPDRAAITRLTANADAVPRHRMWELRFALDRDHSNPYDPDVVDLRCAITTPGGGSFVAPAFWCQDFRRELIDDDERLAPVGPAGWRIRYAPRVEGRHTWRLLLTDAHQTDAVLAEGSFEGVAGDARGYLRRSPAKPRFLAWEDGTFYYPFGHNLCQPTDLQQPYPYDFGLQPDRGTYSYDRYFRKMAAAGENWARIWLTKWHLGLEGRPGWPYFHGAGRYNQANAWRLDHLLARAAEHGIGLQLTTIHKSEYQRKDWPSNPYNVAWGGPLERPQDFFTDPETRECYRKRLRYLVARYGWSPAITGWELFGEANLMPGYKRARDAAIEWHREMAAWLEELDGGRHLVFTHCHNWQRGHGLWALEGIDCVQGNGYIRPPNRTPDHVENFARYLDEVRHYDKPVFVAEYGGRSELGAPSRDYLEAQLHSGLWASLVRDLSGIAMQWWWNFIDGEDLYFHYAAVDEFAGDVDRIAHDLVQVEPAVRSDGDLLRCAGMQDDRLGLYWIYHPEIFIRYEDLEEVGNVALRLADLPDGRWRILVRDCHSGEVVEERVAELRFPAEVPLPDVHRDLAVRIERRSE